MTVDALKFVRPKTMVVVDLNIGYRWRYYYLQYLAMIHNGHYLSGIFSGKSEKMAAGCDDFWRFSAFFRRCVIHHCLIMEHKHFHRENDQCLH